MFMLGRVDLFIFFRDKSGWLSGNVLMIVFNIEVIFV